MPEVGGVRAGCHAGDEDQGAVGARVAALVGAGAGGGGGELVDFDGVGFGLVAWGAEGVWEGAHGGGDGDGGN